MKKQPGDVIITFKLNVSEVARTNKATELHPFSVATQILSHQLASVAADPSIADQGVVWNGVDAGSLKIDRVRAREESWPSKRGRT